MTTTLVTGANKGLGYETARRLLERGQTVYIGARDRERGEAAAAGLGGRFVQIDVTDDGSVQRALDAIEQDEGRLDVLVNNAGIWDGRLGTDGLTGETALREFDTNVIGVIRVTQAALPLLRKSDNPVVVNISSALGSFYATTTAERHESQAPRPCSPGRCQWGRLGRCSPGAR
jgi:NAD(P)-dependent dehydrogenase (short-subunit alcohol dehydrogenase family)